MCSVMVLNVMLTFNMIRNIRMTGIEENSHNHCSHGKAISVTYSECVFVALCTRHVKRVRSIISSFVVCLTVPHLFHFVS
jgi:hypothetical protein